MAKQPCVYILASKKNGALYVGVTSNLLRRIYEHREGLVKGYTKQKGIYQLVWYEMHESMTSAIEREKSLKKWHRAWKIEVIEETNPAWDDLYETLHY